MCNTRGACDPGSTAIPLHPDVWWSWVVVIAWVATVAITVFRRFVQIEFERREEG